MKPKKHVRTIKVQPRYKEGRGYRYVRPELRLCGKWLEELGFTNGQVATITCESKKLIITVE